MSELDEVKAELKQVREELRQFKRDVVLKVKRMIDMHTHSLDMKVGWNLPPALVKEAIKQANAKSKQVDPMQENVIVDDKFVSNLVKVE